MGKQCRIPHHGVGQSCKAIGFGSHPADDERRNGESDAHVDDEVHQRGCKVDDELLVFVHRCCWPTAPRCGLVMVNYAGRAVANLDNTVIYYTVG